MMFTAASGHRSRTFASSQSTGHCLHLQNTLEPHLDSSSVEKILELFNLLVESSELSGLFAQYDGLSEDQTVKSSSLAFPGPDALNTGPSFTILTNFYLSY